jgi:hypothetical protein
VELSDEFLRLPGGLHAPLIGLGVGSEERLHLLEVGLVAVLRDDQPACDVLAEQFFGGGRRGPRRSAGAVQDQGESVGQPLYVRDQLFQPVLTEPSHRTGDAHRRQDPSVRAEDRGGEAAHALLHLL